MSRAIQSNLQEAAAQGGSLTNLCQTVGISCACYYRGLAAPKPTAPDTALREHIQRVALECSCYGYRRITKEMQYNPIREAPQARRPPHSACQRPGRKWITIREGFLEVAEQEDRILQPDPSAGSLKRGSSDVIAPTLCSRRNAYTHAGSHCVPAPCSRMQSAFVQSIPFR